MPKLEVRLSAEEKEDLQKNAESAGMTVSGYVRTKLFHRPERPRWGPMHEQFHAAKPFGADRFK